MFLACSNDQENKQSSDDNSTSAQNKDQNVSVLSDSNDVTTNLIEMPLNQDTSLTLSYQGNPVDLMVYAPDSATVSIKSVLLLHGWNLPPNEWCEKAELCNNLLKEGYHVIAPNFGKSTYHWELYPETIENYRKYPDRKWMYEVFLSTVQDSLGLLKTDQTNAVIGLSTGGRGAALMALERPEIFKACVALSADFDHSKIPDEPINNGFYGSINQFPERWTGKDNIFNRAAEWSVPLYLGHGRLDKMCPVSQTEEFATKLQEQGFDQVVLSIPDSYGHNYEYWSYETGNIFNFLKKFLG